MVSGFVTYTILSNGWVKYSKIVLKMCYIPDAMINVFEYQLRCTDSLVKHYCSML